VEIECLPTQIPEKIDVDVSNLKIGDSVQLKDLKIPEDIRLLQDPGLIVISVASPVEEKPEEAVPTEAAVVEPEVIREKKPVETAEDTKEKQKEK
jgi:large subunit ribosomal protein L25